MFFFVIIIILIVLAFLYTRNKTHTNVTKPSVTESNITESSVTESNVTESNVTPFHEISCPGSVCHILPKPDDPNFPDLAKVPPEQRGFGPDCYLFPGTCPEGYFCQLDDRSRWAKKENGTRGSCQKYQGECMSCTPNLEESILNPENYSAVNMKTYTIDGQFIERPSICRPDLICTGDNVPTIPPTCVKKRPPDRKTPPTRDELIAWSLRFVRLGGRPSKGLIDRKCKNHDANGVCFRYQDTGNASPLTKGASKEDLLKTANHILKVLWPKEFAPYPGELIPGVHDKHIPFCDDDKYLSQLTDYQKANGGPDYRKPVGSEDKKDAPPCIWGSDYAYNDEAPSIWSMLHTITANLPTVITDEQKEALRLIPMYLRQQFSCPDCRGNIKSHLIDIGIPDSYFGLDWFKYFHRAHNYVNESAIHFRAGENNDAGLPWAFNSNVCPGSYMYSWYMPLSSAYYQWKIRS